jgi:hypothetical protein
MTSDRSSMSPCVHDASPTHLTQDLWTPNPGTKDKGILRGSLFPVVQAGMYVQNYVWWILTNSRLPGVENRYLTSTLLIVSPWPVDLYHYDQAPGHSPTWTESLGFSQLTGILDCTFRVNGGKSGKWGKSPKMAISHKMKFSKNEHFG